MFLWGEDKKLEITRIVYLKYFLFLSGLNISSSSYPHDTRNKRWHYFWITSWERRKEKKCLQRRGRQTFMKHQLNYITTVGIPLVLGSEEERGNIFPRPHLNDRCQYVIKIHNKYVIMKLIYEPTSYPQPPFGFFYFMFSFTLGPVIMISKLHRTKNCSLCFWKKIWESKRERNWSWNWNCFH